MFIFSQTSCSLIRIVQTLYDPAGTIRVIENIPLADRSNCFEYLKRGEIFKYVAFRACLERFQNILRILVPGKHYEFDINIFVSDSSHRFYAIEVFHLDVHQHDVRL